MDSAERIRLKTRIFTVIVVLSNALGNLFLTLGLKRWGGELALSPFSYVRAIFHPLVGLGVLLLVLWLLSRMTLLSWADLSYVLPVTAVGYVLSALFGHWFLDEQITTQRWAGTLLIVAGIALVGRTAVRTTE